MRSCVTVEGDRKWRLPIMPDCLLEEGLGCRHIAYPAEPEVDRLSTPVYRSVEIGPAAAHLEIGFIDSLGTTSRSAKAIPTFD
jgi:hypothetical protein